jgi:hypothetical protein
MKTAVKTPSRKTNNQASFGGSLLKNNMEVEAAMELQRHLDETGVHRVCTIYVGGFSGLHHVRHFEKGLPSVNFWTFCLHQVYLVCTKFIPDLH